MYFFLRIKTILFISSPLRLSEKLKKAYFILNSSIAKLIFYLTQCLNK